VASIKPVETALPLAFQNCRGRPLSRPESKVMTDGIMYNVTTMSMSKSKKNLAIFVHICPSFFSVHTAVLAVNGRFSIIEKGVWRQER